MSETGNNIRRLRIEAGYTQKTLAEALHVTDKAVSKWERGLCLPDGSLLPKLSLLLDADIGVIVSRHVIEEEWVGMIDIMDCDFSRIVYDKPLVYFLLSHYLLLGIRRIHVLTTEANREYLLEEKFETLGFEFCFEIPERKNMMVINHPWFLFGSDLTHQYYGAMVSERMTKLVPTNQEPVFLFCREKRADAYFADKKKVFREASVRTLGRGMVCLDMYDYDKILEVASFIRAYQKNAGLLIGSLEEIAYRKGLITAEELMRMAGKVPYGNLLKDIV